MRLLLCLLLLLFLVSCSDPHVGLCARYCEDKGMDYREFYSPKCVCQQNIPIPPEPSPEQLQVFYEQKHEGLE